MQIKIPSRSIGRILTYKRFQQFTQKDQREQPKTQELQQDKTLSKADSQQQKVLNKYQNWKRQDILEVIRQSESQKPKSTEDYRVAILFEDLLRKKKLIDLYDTHGRVFLVKYWIEIFLVSLGIFYAYNIYERKKWKRKFDERIKLGFTLFFIFSRLHLFRRLQKYHVEKIIYNTENKLLNLQKRSLLGFKKVQEIPTEKLLFTQDQSLNARGINYINIDTMECYQIGYVYAWKNKELFSHLLKQNVQNIRKQNKI